MAETSDKKAAKRGAPKQKGETTPTVRERLLDATLRQVRVGGLASVTARTICNEVGITAPTLYHYFGDLPGLYCEVLEGLFESNGPEHPSEVDDPEGVIDYIWFTLLELAERESGIIDLFNQLLASGRVPDLMQKNYGRLEAAFEVLSHKKPLKVDSRLAAEIYWAAALGMSTLVAAAQHGVPYPTGAANVLRQCVLDGIFT